MIQQNLILVRVFIAKHREPEYNNTKDLWKQSKPVDPRIHVRTDHR